MRQDLTVETGLDEMVRLMTRFATGDGIHPTAIERMTLIRASQPNDLVHAVHQPSVCVIAQGSKRVILGDELY